MALNGVSMEVKEGEFVAIMGPSGCGKSTLLNILGLLDNPDGGTYMLDGEEVANMKERERTRLRKGRIEYLVTRHIPQQSFNVMNRFAECVIKGTSPLRRNNYVHMDILHKRNLDDY